MKTLQLGQGDGELRDVFVIQFECAPSVAAVAPHVQIELVPKHSNCGEEREIDNGGGGRSIDAQNSQRLLHPGQWRRVLGGGSSDLHLSEK